MQAATIEDVIDCIETIIENCKEKSSRMGYFATLYKAMTIGVQTGIEQGAFEDGARMEQLDVAFANRYLSAYSGYVSGQVVSHSWMHAFKASEQDSLTVIQHLLLAINAHINLDLGIATASISTPEDLENLHGDYNQINTVITNVYNAMEHTLRKISWPAIFLKPLDAEGLTNVINFSIRKARDAAWANANLLVGENQVQDNQIINTTDAIIAKVSTAIQNPRGIVRLITRSILLFESKDVTKNIRILNHEI